MVFYSHLAGVSYRNEGINTEHRQVIIMQLKNQGLLEEGQELYLETQPWNKHDNNAVAIYGYDKRQIGYLSKEMAANVCSAISMGLCVKVFSLKVTGGFNGTLFGVNIKIEITKPLENVYVLCDKNSAKNIYDYEYEVDWNPHSLEEDEYENWLDSFE